MNDSAELERRYRRLLACYPRSFRDEQEEEILTVLMAGAAPGQRRPRFPEFVDLIKYALWMRLGLSKERIMINETTFPISVDRPSQALMKVFGASGKGPRIKVSPTTVDIRMGWAFHAALPRHTIKSVRPLSRDDLHGPFRISVLRGVNYWRGTALVNGAGTGLVQISLDQTKWARLGPLRAPIRQVIVSADDRPPLIAALSPDPQERDDNATQERTRTPTA